ncbi:nucleotidyltransferase family protein [Sphingomonas sp. 1P06PA]|uniref:nucleotidyltransferase domain-containing protein n=1 Tax=Sphingomonas sp. 1P06PA TaxID=554121 RepID=UPI0039A4117F
MTAALLVRALADPATTAGLSPNGWTALLCAARAEQMAGTLADRLDGQPVPAEVAAILAAARISAEEARRAALWEAEMARRALAPLAVPLVLLKGTAFAAADLDAARGRAIGDLDILVPRDRLDAVEAALISAGWEWVKDDPYDQLYYRRWMHELPPLIHRARDRMIDVHHTILPPTARPKPCADLLIAEARPIESGLPVLHPADMIVHAAAHLFADGDLAGGLRNLWDIDRLLRQLRTDPAFDIELRERAMAHDLVPHVARALRLSASLYGTPVDAALAGRARPADRLYRRRLLARDGWGRATRPATRLAFYVRSHAIRMPPAMLARHLWIKWRKAG